MTEPIDKLRATLSELQDELHAIESLDSQARELLQDTVREIDETLHQQGVEHLPHDTIAERLAEAARGFDESHPALSRIVGNLVKLLGQIGI